MENRAVETIKDIFIHLIKSDKDVIRELRSFIMGFESELNYITNEITDKKDIPITYRNDLDLKLETTKRCFDYEKSEKKKLEKKIEKLQDKLEVLEKEKESLEEKLQEKNKDLDKEKSQKENLRDTVFILEEKLKIEKDKVNTKLEEFDKLQDKLEVLEKEKENLEEKLQEKNKDLDKEKSQKENLRDTVFILEEKLKIEKDKVNTKLEEVDKLQDKLEVLEKEKENLEKKLDEKNNDLKNEKLQKENLTCELKCYKNKYDEVEDIYNNYKNLSNETRESLSRIIPMNVTVNEFMMCGAEYNKLEMIWDFIKDKAMNNSDEYKILYVIFEHFFNVYNKINNNIYEIVSVNLGDEFDDNLHIRKGNIPSGNICDIVLKGYKNTRLDKIIRKSVVELK